MKDKRILNRKMNLPAVVCVLVAVFCFQSSAMSASWSPGDALRSYLMKNYPWEEIEVSNVQVAGKISNSLPEKIIVEKGPIGRAAFSFVFSNGKRVIVRANVSVFAMVVKSRRPFRKSHIIQHEDIYVEKMDIRKMPNGSVTDPSKITGKSLKRSIAANIPIVEGMIEASEVVARGRRVVLLINYNGLNIRAAGKTKERGYVGMTVRAINLSSKREVSGILIDKNTVRVEI